MSYLNNNFSVFLEKNMDTPVELSNQDYDATTNSIDASKIVGGVVSSTDNKTQFDLNNNTYIINDGLAERVRLGIMEDGEYGIRIKDKDGNVLMNVTASEAILQGPLKRLQIDLIKDQIRVFDDVNLRGLIGVLE